MQYIVINMGESRKNVLPKRIFFYIVDNHNITGTAFHLQIFYRIAVPVVTNYIDQACLASIYYLLISSQRLCIHIFFGSTRGRLPVGFYDVSRLATDSTADFETCSSAARKVL